MRQGLYGGPKKALFAVALLVATSILGVGTADAAPAGPEEVRRGLDRLRTVERAPAQASAATARRVGRIVPAAAPRTATPHLVDPVAARRDELVRALHGIGRRVGTRLDTVDVVSAAHALGLNVGRSLDPSDVERVLDRANARAVAVVRRLGIDPGARVDDGDWKRAGAAVGLATGQKVDLADVRRIIDASLTRRARVDRRQAAAPTAPVVEGTARRLYLGIGHGRTHEGKWDPGSLGRGTTEERVNAVVVAAMARRLTELGVAFEAEHGDHPAVRGSVARANTGGFTDCIEIHHEWTGAPPGTFAHWYPGSAVAERTADRLVGALAELGIPVRGDWHRPRKQLYLLRESRCNAVLIELGRVGEYDAATLERIGRTLADAYAAEVGG